MEQRSVFFEEWMRSLREQYKHVVAQDDRVTLHSLTGVMLDVGFSENELAQLRVEATMHVDQVGSDHVADMAILEHTLPHAPECLCPLCAAPDETCIDTDNQPAPMDPQPDKDEPASVLETAALEKNATSATSATSDESETSETSDTSDLGDLIDLIEEAVPLTFEESLAAQESEVAGMTDANEENGESSDDTEEDDNPLQMSLF